MVLLLLFHISNTAVNGCVVSVTKDVEQDVENTHDRNGYNHSAGEKNHYRRIGRIRYHYDDDGPYGSSKDPLSSHHSCSHVVVTGVGTSMSVDQYDKIAAQIVTGTSIVFVVSNHNVNGLAKTSAEQYARLLNNIHDHLNEILVPVCQSQIDAKKHIVIGGHSSSGQAAFEAAQSTLLNFQPLAFFGLDPFQISPSTIATHKPLYLPALYWGLTETTCFVNVEAAALGAYSLTSPHVGGKVLYSIVNKDKDTTHCVFTDHGCGMGIIVVCPTEMGSEWVYEAVAQSLQMFLKALDSEHKFERQFFELPRTKSGQVVLHVNEEVVLHDKKLLRSYRAM
jgi:hypothetical protein